jgi:hypothetical protein
MSNRIAQDKAYNYLLSGKATVTFHNTLTKNQFTFTIKQKMAGIPKVPVGVWYVYNCSDYIGFIRGDMFIVENTMKNSILRADAIKAFRWCWNAILQQKIPNTMEILHEGTCGHCHRVLTDAVSLSVGIGPECRKKLGIHIENEKR